MAMFTPTAEQSPRTRPVSLESSIWGPHSSVGSGARIGDGSILHAGVVVGCDGFGYVFDGARQLKVPQVGGVVIEDDVEIGANTTFD